MGLYGLIWYKSLPVYAKWCSDHSWLFHVCQFNNDHEIAIKIEHAALKPKRLHDRAIMDVVQEIFDSKAELRAINRVRMLHGVVPDNVFLSRAQFGGSRNDFLWPAKHHVSSSDYTTWSKAVEFVFAGTNQTLTTPLGSWLVDCDRQWIGEWDWFVTFDRESFYFRSFDTEWYQY